MTTPDAANISHIVPVILSGGAGTRLWPLSRELLPKQLLSLTSDSTLLQETALRLGRSPMMVCNVEHRFVVAEQLRVIGLEPRAVIVEPMGRNTAPAVAVAALLLQDDPDALMLVMPSDHIISDITAFHAALARGEPLARSGHLVTFGIIPSKPNTGYGYIKRGTALDTGWSVEGFVEKPDLATAMAYLESGSYLWNSGIFLFSPKAILAEMETYCPDIPMQCRDAIAKGQTDMFFFRLAEDVFGEIRGISIDYAVMEKTAKAAVVDVDMGWSDIGTWSALWQQDEKDDDGNCLHGDVIAVDSRDCLIRSGHRLVATLGVKDLVVVETDDAVLVASKEHDQDVKRLVDELKRKGRSEAVQNSRIHRPWGWFQTIDNGERFRVKHIQVNPGAKLSLQKHWHRSEHWVVVSGTALVTRGEETFVLRENESVFIPLGAVHRLENPGRLPLRIIEVQSGDYVGEDDIVRLNDDYGRSP